MALTQPPSPARTELENKLNSQKAEMDRQLLQSAQEILQLRIVSIPRPLVKECVPKKMIFLFLIQNICCGYSKEPSQ